LGLDRDEWFVAITFGVLIDADHLFAAPRYISDNGWGAILAPTWDDGSGLPWKSAFHHPEGAFVVGYLSVGWRFFMPMLFWGSHVALDELQLATLEHSAVVETLLLAGIVSGIVLVGHSRWSALHPDEDVRAYARYVVARMVQLLRRRGGQVSRRPGTI